MIDSARTGLRKANFLNIAEKNDSAAVPQMYKTSRDQGETVDLEYLLSDLVGVFAHDTVEAEPTLQASMLATNTHIKDQLEDSRGSSNEGGASRSANHSNGKRRL